jgi:hypothetical protein
MQITIGGYFGDFWAGFISNQMYYLFNTFGIFTIGENIIHANTKYLRILNSKQGTLQMNLTQSNDFH